MPPFLHLILINRTHLNIQLSRLIAARKVARITEDDLAFTPVEIKNLYSLLFDIQLSKDNIDALHKKTGGWVSGLILFCFALKKKTNTEIEQAISKFKGSHRIIYNYLEENVYDQLPDDKKQFLIKTSILSRIDVEFCNQFLNTKNSQSMLCDLEDDCVFTFSKCWLASINKILSGFSLHFLKTNIQVGMVVP